LIKLPVRQDILINILEEGFFSMKLDGGLDEVVYGENPHFAHHKLLSAPKILLHRSKAVQCRENGAMKTHNTAVLLPGSLSAIQLT
jgi:hypothetical protein